MTDPKELQALANSPFLWTEHEHGKVIDALKTLARILATDTDTREIEHRHAIKTRVVELMGAPDQTHSDRATLLDANRRLRAELEAATEVVDDRIAETDRYYAKWKHANARADRLAEKLGDVFAAAIESEDSRDFNRWVIDEATKHRAMVAGEGGKESQSEVEANNVEQRQEHE